MKQRIRTEFEDHRHADKPVIVCTAGNALQDGQMIRKGDAPAQLHHGSLLQLSPEEPFVFLEPLK